MRGPKCVVVAAVALVACLLSVGCAGWAFAPVMPPTGLAFTGTTAPLDVDLDKADLGSKVGESSSHCVLGLVAFGDASTAAAARDGGIRTMKHADYKMLNVLMLYSCYTTVVYGD
ncbi:MAG: TRL-like family protein [Candidatus Brocadiaceae bacterium]|jgi:hypothetical protein